MLLLLLMFWGLISHTQTPTSSEVLAVVHELSCTVNQTSPAHAQCGLLAQPAGLVDGGGQRQIHVSNAGVLLSMLSKDVTQFLREGQSESIKTVKISRDDKTVHIWNI